MLFRVQYLHLCSYKILLGVWQESMEYVKVSDMRCRIRGVMAYKNKFDFLFCCLLGEQLLRQSDILSKALQTKSLSAAEGQKMALSTLKTLKSLRTDEYFSHFMRMPKEELHIFGWFSPHLFQLASYAYVKSLYEGLHIECKL